MSITKELLRKQNLNELRKDLWILNDPEPRNLDQALLSTILHDIVKGIIDLNERMDAENP